MLKRYDAIFDNNNNIYAIMRNYLTQAFLKPAQEIYSKIQRGIYDVSNESYGIKVGIASQNTNPAGPSNNGGGKQKDGGCCIIL